MNAPSLKPHVYHFCFPALDTQVEVEEAAGEVTIRASRNSFSEARKSRFIHELAAEGFIPDENLWFNSAASGGTGRVRWVIERTCFMPDQKQTARTRRIMVRILGSAVVFWFLLMGLILARGFA